MSATWPSNKNLQKLSGELQPPGRRHANPITAMGVWWVLVIVSELADNTLRDENIGNCGNLNVHSRIGNHA